MHVTHKRSLTTTAVAVAAGLLVAIGTAAAQSEDYSTSEFVESDAELYEFYDVGYDDTNTDDDWFYDYYEVGADTGIESAGIDYADEDWAGDWDVGLDTDGDATDQGTDDAGDEGVLDF